MPFDYQTLQLEALLAHPIFLDEDEECRAALAKSRDMKQLLLHQIIEGKIKYVQLFGKKYELKEVHSAN